MEPIIAAASGNGASASSVGAITHQVYTAYGLSGSGKTHALVSSAHGFLKCVVGQLASLMQQNPSVKITFGVKDIYGEHVVGQTPSGQLASDFDSECLAAWKIANPNAAPIDLERATLWSFSNGETWQDTDFQQGEELDVSYMQMVTDVNALELIPDRCVNLATHKKRTNLRKTEGGMHRYHVRTTPNNDESSRAHTVLRFVVADAVGRTLGRVSLIDMAGAEDVDAIQSAYYHKVQSKMVVKEVPAITRTKPVYPSLKLLVEGLLMDDVLKNEKIQTVQTFTKLWKPAVRQIKFKVVDQEYNVANVGAWRQLRDSLRDDEDKKDCTRVIRCPAPTENIVDLIEGYCDMLDAKCRILEVLTALTTRENGVLKLQYFSKNLRNTRGESFDSFWQAVRRIGDTQAALKGHPSQAQLEKELKHNRFKRISPNEPEFSAKLTFDLWTPRGGIVDRNTRVQVRTTAATSLLAAPGFVYMGVRDALISSEDDVDGLIPKAPGVDRIKPTFEMPSVWTRLGLAMSMITHEDGIPSALKELNEYSEADVSSDLLDLLEMVTGKRWGATIADFRKIMVDTTTLQTVDERKSTATFLADGGELRNKISAVKRLVTDHKRAMGKVHCPLRFQGKYIMSTLDDLKTLAKDLSVNAHSDTTQKGWLRSALQDTHATNEEDLRLTQVVAIRTDFDKHGGFADDKRLRDGACQSLQFAANVNPLVTSECNLGCDNS